MRRGQVKAFLNSVDVLRVPLKMDDDTNERALVWVSSGRSKPELEVWHFRIPGKTWALAGLAAVLVTAFFVSGCASGPSAQDQADLVSVAQAIETATSRTLTPDEAAANQAALVRLGVSLADVERARVAAEIWDVARPILIAGIGWLLGSET